MIEHSVRVELAAARGRQIGMRVRVFMIAAAASVLLVGCSAGGGRTGVRTARATDVVAVQSSPYPEGPASPRVASGDPGWARIATALPAELPFGLAQPPRCSFGNITTLTLRNGKTIDYGPCKRPPSIDALRCLLANMRIGCR